MRSLAATVVAGGVLLVGAGAWLGYRLTGRSVLGAIMGAAAAPVVAIAATRHRGGAVVPTQGVTGYRS